MFGVAMDTWGCCQGCLGSLQTLEVEVVVGGQCHSRCSGSLRKLRVEVTAGQGHLEDTHGHCGLSGLLWTFMVRSDALDNSGRQGAPGWGKNLYLAQPCLVDLPVAALQLWSKADCSEEGTVAYSRQGAQSM